MTQGRSWWVRYGAALFSVALATLLRFWLDRLLADAGFALFIVAVIIAAWFGGIGPSLFALALSLAASGAFFSRATVDEPEPVFRVLFGLAVFMFVGLATAILSESMRSAQFRAESQAEEAVGQREQLRTILACIGDGVVVCDRNGHLTMMNHAAELLTGWSVTDAVGQPLESVLRTSDEQRVALRDDPVTQALRDGITVSQAPPAILVAKDGSERPINECAAPLRDENGNISGVVLIVRDVTEQRRTERALRDADRRKDEFLAMLAHELRNPLAPVCSAIEVLQGCANNPQAMSRATELLDRQVQHLVRLVDDLLDVSRIMRGKIELRPETVDVRTIIARSTESVDALIAAGRHELTVTVPDAPLLLTADPVRLAQVTNNLLTNAAKYTEPGGRIWISAEAAGNFIVIRVRDSGIGIPKEMLPAVFDLFTQVDSSVSRSQGGLGVGLTLVKRLVELSGGNVEACSDGVGKGSEFVVYLPRGAAAEIGLTASDKLDLPLMAATPHRIVVADDNLDAAEMLAMLLRFEGHEVIVAHDGPSALEAASTHAPELIFLDIGMPRMDGFEVAKRLRQSPRAANLTIVALTGWGLEEDIQRTKAAGFDFHLVKPVSSHTINQLLARQGQFAPPDAVA